MLQFILLKRNKVRAGGSESGFCNHDIADDRASVKMSAVEEGTHAVSGKIEDKPFLIDNHAVRPQQANWVDELDHPADCCSHAFVQRS